MKSKLSHLTLGVAILIVEMVIITSILPIPSFAFSSNGAQKTKQMSLDLPYLGINGGSYGMFAFEANLLLLDPNLFINGCLYFRNNFDYDRNIIGNLGIEIGPRIYSNELFYNSKIYTFCGANLGLSDNSSGTPGFMFGPSKVEINGFYAPYIGLVKRISTFCVSGIAEKYFYNGISFDVYKVGISI